MDRQMVAANCDKTMKYGKGLTEAAPADQNAYKMLKKSVADVVTGRECYLYMENLY